MTVARWTKRFEVVVQADLDSVVAWYTSADRREESRAHFAAFDVRDFRYDERVEGDRRMTAMSWTTQSGMHVFLEIRGTVFDGEVVRDAEGRVVRRGETYQFRRWPGGREDTSQGEVIAEFSELPGDRTLARITQTRQKEPAPWWERWLPPVAERKLQQRQMEELFARCERDLGHRSD